MILKSTLYTILAIIIVTIMVNIGLLIWKQNRLAKFDAPNYSKQQLALGQDLFDGTCAACHGLKGQGNAKLNPPVPALNGSEHAWHHTDAQVATWIRTGIGKMPVVQPNWSDEQITAVHAYIKQWWSLEKLAWQTEATNQSLE